MQLLVICAFEHFEHLMFITQNLLNLAKGKYFVLLLCLYQHKSILLLSRFCH